MGFPRDGISDMEKRDASQGAVRVTIAGFASARAILVT
jgi:hypothetical protein